MPLKDGLLFAILKLLCRYNDNKCELKKIKNTTKGYWHTLPTHILAIIFKKYMSTPCCQPFIFD